MLCEISVCDFKCFLISVAAFDGAFGRRVTVDTFRAGEKTEEETRKNMHRGKT